MCVYVCVCSFNPIARTNAVRTLQKIVNQEKVDCVDDESVEISRSSLEEIAECCAGDIRAAINALQFACSKGTCCRIQSIVFYAVCCVNCD